MGRRLCGDDHQARDRAAALGRSELTVPRIALGCGNFGGIGSAPELFGQGLDEDQAFALMDAAWELGIDPLRHRRRLRRRPQRDASSAAGSRSRGRAAALTTKTYNPMDAGDDHGLSPRADRAPAHVEPPAARRRPRRALPRARVRPRMSRWARRSGRSSGARRGPDPAVGVSNYDAFQLAKTPRPGPATRSRTRTRCSCAATRPCSRSAPTRAGRATRRSARSPAAG